MKFKTYAETQDWAAKKGIETSKQWFEWVKQNEKPKSIPSHPEREYKDVWKGWSAFFGRKDRTNSKGFLSYEEAVKKNHELKLRTAKSYREYVRLHTDCRLPKTPTYVYREKWTGWADFLFDRYVTLDKVVEIAIKEDIKEWRDWVKFSNTKRPEGVPGDIFRTYGITITDLLRLMEESKTKKVNK